MRRARRFRRPVPARAGGLHPVAATTVALVLGLMAAACSSGDGGETSADGVRSEVVALGADEELRASPTASSTTVTLAVSVSSTPSSVDPAGAATSDPTASSAEASPADGTSTTGAGTVSTTTGAGQGSSSTASTAATPTTAATGTSTGPTSAPTTTAPPTTTATTPTTRPTVSSTTARPGGDTYFATLGPGASLPSGEWCAARVKPRGEVRAVNAGFNATRGTASNDRYPRVDGAFTGTTDEIIQWAACKWGIDEDWARAQMAKESWWDMTVGGDLTTNQDACHPQVRTGSGTCPESLGLSQVRFLYHGEAFEDANALRSTAYNVDYAYAVWRSCFEGELGWLNTVERGATYGPGDLEGCLGVWFAGRWKVAAANTYVDAVRDYKNSRIWESPNFLSYG